MFNSELYEISSIGTCISCVVMCTLLYAIEAESLENFAIAVIYFKETYTIPRSNINKVKYMKIMIKIELECTKIK